MLHPVLTAPREVAVAADEEVVVDLVTEDVGDVAVVVGVEVALAIVDEVDPEVAVARAQTAEASETSKARSRLSKSRGIA